MVRLSWRGRDNHSGAPTAGQRALLCCAGPSTIPPACVHPAPCPKATTGQTAAERPPGTQGPDRAPQAQNHGCPGETDPFSHPHRDWCWPRHAHGSSTQGGPGARLLRLCEALTSTPTQAACSKGHRSASPWKPHFPHQGVPVSQLKTPHCGQMSARPQHAESLWAARVTGETSVAQQGSCAQSLAEGTRSMRTRHRTEEGALSQEGLWLPRRRAASRGGAAARGLRTQRWVWSRAGLGEPGTASSVWTRWM